MARSKVVSVRYNPKEIKVLKREAEAELLTLQQLIRIKTIGDHEFVTTWRKLLNVIKNLDPGKFLPRELIVESEWNQIWRGTRTSIGKHLYSMVKQGKIPGVEALPRVGSIQPYQKHSVIH